MLENRLLKSRSSAIGAAETSSTDATKNNAEDVDDVSSSDKEVEHYTTYLRLGHIHLLANDFAKGKYYHVDCTNHNHISSTFGLSKSLFTK